MYNAEHIRQNAENISINNRKLWKGSRFFQKNLQIDPLHTPAKEISPKAKNFSPNEWKRYIF